MKILKTIAELNDFRNSLHGTVGFIPTMGYLHTGHVSLVKRAQKENDHVLVSIFVNPKQFGPHEDFQKYPRDTEKDLTLLRNSQTNSVFLPTVEELYPDDFETSVTFETISKKLEGAVRPSHFTGVATVLTKFFNLVRPTHAYFGQKDAQQVAVVKKLVADLNFPLQIIVGDTVREADGLAMSSRNVFLTPVQRQEAPILYESLHQAEKMLQAGETDAQKIKNEMQKMIEKTSGMIDYISVADAKTLDDVATVQGKTLVSLAVRFGNTRLIDNILFET